MGGRGPRPVRSIILEARRSKRAKDRKDGLESEQAVPILPKWLRGESRKMWKYIVPVIEEMGCMTKADPAALIRFCECWGQWIDATKNIKEHGQVIKMVLEEKLDDEGNVVWQKTKEMVSPWFKVQKDLASELRKLEDVFGLSPAARSRIHAGDLTPSKHGNAKVNVKRASLVRLNRNSG